MEEAANVLRKVAEINGIKPPHDLTNQLRGNFIALNNYLFF